MDYDLTAGQHEILKLVKKICAENIIPIADCKNGASGFKSADFMEKNMTALLPLGAPGVAYPQDIVSFCIAGEQIAKTCPSTFLSIASTAFAGGLVNLFGTPKQKTEYSFSLAGSNRIGALAVTEEGAGSDLDGISTTGELWAGQWVLNGKKAFVTNAPIAGFMLVMAKTAPGGGLEEGMSFFIIDRDAKGLTIGEPIETLGLEGAAISEIVLTDCVLAPSAIIGMNPGHGYMQYQGIMPLLHLAMAAYALGVGSACMEESTRYAKKREAFGKPIGYFEGVGAKLATMFTLLDLGRMLMRRAAWGIERNDSDAAILSACAKLFTSESVRTIADMTMQIHAGHGYRKGSLPERLYRDARFAEIAYGDI